MLQAEESINSRKGLGIGNDHEKWNLLNEDVSLPTAVLVAENLEHNLRWMQNFIDKYRVKLAPHGKTTMAPKLFHQQIERGAWGLTLATAHQVQIAHSVGIRHIIMANQLIGKTNILMIRQLLDEDQDFDFYCLIDSVDNVENLSRHFPSEKGRKLQVLLEIGVEQGRTGIRTENDEKSILDALKQHQNSVELVGIELFEGVLNDEIQVRSMLKRAVASFERIEKSNGFTRQPAILSGAGSSWYDVVAEEFSSTTSQADIILRPGCYLSHDNGIYHKAQMRILDNNLVAREISQDHGALRPALQIWAYVQSVPESNRAIINFGKRDAAFDAGFPMPILHHRPGWSKPKSISNEQYQITKMMDQHAFMTVHGDGILSVGDMIGFNISHPCLTFDRWKYLLVIDQDFNVVDVIETQF